MSFYVVLRGPLGVGKTTVARALTDRLVADYLSIDRILEQEGLWVAGRLSEFLRANTFAAAEAEGFLARGTPVVFDGNFYWKTQLEDLAARLRYPHFVFTLNAPLRVCIERDRRREHPYGSQATREVYAKSTKFDYGVGLDATRPVPSLVREIASHCSGIQTPSRA
ncbi:MAG: ATP-binding protein [Thermoplasmata archaeon]